MSKPHLFSASQVSSYEMCPRKWAWNKVDGLPSTSNKYAEMGTQVHSHLETWLTKRKLPAVGEAAAIANAMIPYLPPPQAIDAENVERRFVWSFEDVSFQGFIDLVQVGTSKDVTIYDHKTTSDLQWAKSEEDLLDDVQATLYARVLMDQMSTDTVQLQWTYATRKARPQVLPVKITVTRDDIESRVAHTVASAREMQEILLSECSAVDVPYNASACGAFGGCPFQANCNLTTRQKVQSAMSQENQHNSFLQRLQARKATGATNPSGAAAALAVNPPEAARAEMPAAPPTLPHAEPESSPESSPDVQDIEEQLAEVSAAVAAPFKRGRGRPRKDEQQHVSDAPAAALPGRMLWTAPVAAAPVAAHVHVPVAAAHVAAAPVAASVAASAGWTLFLDCQPVKGATAEHVSERLARVLLEYTAETGQSHYKLADYGKGPAIFSEGFAKDLAANRPKGGIIANTASQEVRDVLQVLMACATNIVQG